MELDIAKIREYGSLELLARQMVEGFITGLHKSPYHGFSVEFAEHKLYNPGENTRHIDWKVFARTERLYTKRYEEETNLRCMLLIDRSPSMYYPLPGHNKLKFAIMSAACIAYMLQRQRDAVGLTLFQQQIEQLTAIKTTPAHLRSLFVLLEQTLNQQPSTGATDITEVLHQVAAQIHKRSLVVLFTDLLETNRPDEELFAALQHLKHNKHEVILFHVYDGSTELELNFSEKPHIFVDVETGEQQKLRPSQVREAYRQRVNKRLKELKLRCGQYKIDFVEADSQRSVDQVLQAFLIKRKRMA
jgi:uncharacterized protein (DUF58 family)